MAIRAQFWLFAFQDGPGDRSYCDAFDPIFSDTLYMGPESEITDFTERETGLNIPYWLADLFLDGLKYG
jgi:hypothetical protein